MSLSNAEQPNCGFVVSAALKFETDGGKPLEVYIFVDRTTAKKYISIASYKCGKFLYDQVLNALGGPALTDIMMARLITDIIKECDKDNPDCCTYRCFLHRGIRIIREIEVGRIICYGSNGEWRWPEFPEKIKKYLKKLNIELNSF